MKTAIIIIVVLFTGCRTAEERALRRYAVDDQARDEISRAYRAVKIKGGLPE